MSQFGVVRSTLENISLITASKALVSVTVVSGDNALTRWELRMESLWDRRLMWGFFQGSYFILFYFIMDCLSSPILGIKKTLNDPVII